ncbi:MAG: TRAP transporter TatT component family protein [Myxococcota bacterium]
MVCSALRPSFAALVVGLLAGSQVACLGRIATGAAANALAGSGTVYSSDEDPELVKEAIPFGLKTMESVLAERPEHRGLLLALTQGFTSYAYGFIEEEAFKIEVRDMEEAERMTARARKLYARALAYGFRNLNERIEGFEERFTEEPAKVLAELDVEDVPILYWTGAAWGLMINASELDPAMVAQFPAVTQMVDRAMELDEDWDRGSLHDFKVVLESARPGGSLDEAERHYRRALELNGGVRAGTYVGFAESICIPRQDGAAFVDALNKALAVDLESNPAERLNNVINQRRARLLLDRSGDLFLDDPLASDESTVRVRTSNLLDGPSS